LSWFLRGVHRRKCKNHDKRAMRNEGKGIRDNVATWPLREVNPAEWESRKIVGFEA